MDGVLALLSPADVRLVVEAKEARDAAREASRALRTAPGFSRAVDELVDPCGPGGKCAATARRLKREADAALVVGAHDISVRTYNDALRAAPDRRDLVAPLRSNRAAALLRLAAAVPFASHARHHLLRLAHGDCDAALSADPSLVRARVRRTAARRALGRVRDALDDARRVVADLEARDAPGTTRDVARRRLETLEAESANEDHRGSSASPASSSSSSDANTFPSATVPSFASDAEPRPTTRAGVGVFATRSLRPGDAACVETAHVAMLRRERARVACHRCFARVPIAVVPCRGCRVAAYCSETCRDDDANDPGAHAGECGGGCWPAVLPQHIVLARRAIARADAEGRPAPRSRPAHRSRLTPRSAFDLAGGDGAWRDMDASDRAALATACAVASSCVVAGETVDAGDVAAATLAIRANAFTVRTRRASPASFSNPDPESRADASWDALARDVRSGRRFLDAWREMSAEDDVVATALFLSTSRFNHACDPNAHVALEIIPARARDEEKTTPTPRDASLLRVSRTFRVRAATRATRPVAADEAVSVSYGPAVGDAPATERRERLAASHGFACECESCVDVRADATPPGAFIVDARLAAAVDDARAALERVADETETPGFSRARDCSSSILRRAREALERAIDASHLPRKSSRALGEAEDCAARVFVACGDVAGAANRARRALASVEALYPRDALAPAMERARVAALLAAAGMRAKEAKTLADEAGRTLRAHVGGDARDDATPCAARRAALLAEAVAAFFSSGEGRVRVAGADEREGRVGVAGANERGAVSASGVTCFTSRGREKGEGLYELD